ncbi:exodeoxyribonuclease III [Candidatus Woesearchaeota archaeon]|nr:exodeoxyribonuclease III [Candidatus Woesearchaeota archaeon]
MKLLSWNVNGIRAVQKKGFHDFLKKENPDILCIQETKWGTDHEELNIEGYHEYWNPAEKKGYSGTLVFTKTEPLNVTKGIGKKEHDGEGRVLTLEYKDFYLVNVYVPNAQHELARLDYRMQWDKDFKAHLKSLDKKKPVIVCGDFNVAHKEIDLARPKANVKNAGFTPEERAGFQAFIDAGFIDTLREFNAKPEQYTWWSFRMNARARNVGWRIDYFLVSERFKKQLKDAFIMPKVMGSDHCPVGIEI